MWRRGAVLARPDGHAAWRMAWCPPDPRAELASAMSTLLAGRRRPPHRHGLALTMSQPARWALATRPSGRTSHSVWTRRRSRSCTRPSRPGGRPASRSFSTTSRACAPTTVWRACSSRKTVPRCPRRRAPCARRAIALSHGNRRGLHRPARSRQVQGPALEFGRMEATASDPDVPQQFGMIVGRPTRGR